MDAEGGAVEFAGLQANTAYESAVVSTGEGNNYGRANAHAVTPTGAGAGAGAGAGRGPAYSQPIEMQGDGAGRQLTPSSGAAPGAPGLRRTDSLC